jgi:CspA family cold shock protein
MSIGTVKWFNPDMGYGLIQSADGSRDVFVDIGAVQQAGMGNLVEGQKISFEVMTDWFTGKMSADPLHTA